MSVPTNTAPFSNDPPDTNVIDAVAVNEKFDRIYNYLNAGIEKLAPKSVPPEALARPRVTRFVRASAVTVGTPGNSIASVFDAANPLLYDTGAAVQVGTNGLRPTADGYYIVEFSLRGKFIAPSTIAVPGAGPVINVQLLVNGMTNEPLGSPTSPTQYANTNDALWSTDIRKVNVTKVIRLAQTDLVQLELYIDSTDFSASFQHFGLELGLTYLGPV